MDLNIPESETTPSVSFDAESSTLTLRGESYPENPTEFFDRIGAWLEASLGETSTLELRLLLYYLNTGSTMGLRELLRILERKQAQGSHIQVEWLHLPGLEIMQTAGQELLQGTPLPHRITATEAI